MDVKKENGQGISERNMPRGGKKRKTGKSLKYLFAIFLSVSLALGGCGKEEGGTGAPTEVAGIPAQKGEQPGTEDAPQTGGSTETGDAPQSGGSSGTGDVPQSGNSTETGDASQAGNSSEAGDPSQPDDVPEENTALLPLVTPVPQEMVTEIAGSIAPQDYPVVDGSTATLPLSQALYCYATGEGQDAAEAAIVHTKTTNSYYRLYNGEADLLIVYEPPQEIIDRMQTENLLIKPIGLDALVFMANEGNPVQSLTKQQLIDIYSGEIKNWKDVGGTDKELLAFRRPEGSGSQTLMQKLVMGDVAMEDGDNVFRYSTMADILEGMVAYNGEANTLGYSVFYYANFMYSLPSLRFMGVDGIMPSMQSIYDGSYPFINAFYAVIRPDEPQDSNARRLFDWLTGQNGQQMVLDLGYVPVTMPEGVDIVQKEAERAGEPQVTPVQNLAPGQHFVLFQREPEPTNNDYGDVWIYDENWNCIDSFRTVGCSQYGVTDSRYIEIFRWRGKKNEEEENESDKSETDNGNRLYIYDLAEGEFVDFSGITSGMIDILDAWKGYFKCYDVQGGARVIDRAGNVLLDWVPYMEEDVMVYREQNGYSAGYWGGDLGTNLGFVTKIYGPDFDLKTIIYDEPEDMPPEEERMDGVSYLYQQYGGLLSEDGDVLLSPEIFLSAFGNGTDMECVIGGERVEWEWKSSLEPLYAVSYAGENWYVDAKCNAYMKEGDKRLSFRDKEKADEVYYEALVDGKWKYFMPDGSPMKASTFEEEPDYISIGEDGNYALAKKTSQGYMVEIVVPEDDFCGKYQYESSKTRYRSIEYMEPYAIALSGSYTDQDDIRHEELVIYRKNHTELFSGESVSYNPMKNWETNVWEDVWLVGQHDGKSQTLTKEGQVQKLYLYTVVIDGYARFTTSIPGTEVSSACHDGYLQIEAGGYTYVYDYDGNQIIKAYNRIMAEE